MNTPSRAFETAMLALIGVVLLAGGISFLHELGRAPLVSGLALGLLMVLQVSALRRDAVAPGRGARVRASRDVAFLAATIAAICWVFSPARWSSGAALAALEFGLVLEILSRLAPVRPAANAGGPGET